MPNYAVNNITFSSRSRLMLEELHAKVSACYRVKEGHSNLVRGLMIDFNFDPDTIYTITNRTDVISDCDKAITTKGKVHFFSMETTTGWSSNMEPIIEILKKKFHNKIHLSYVTEEPGCELFFVHDNTGIFYPDRFRLDFCYKETYVTEYFTSIYTLVDYIKEAFPLADISYYDSISDIKEEVDNIYCNDEEEYFFNINRFVEPAVDNQIYEKEAA